MGQALGPRGSQNGLKSAPIMTSPTKKTKSKTFKFFSMQTRRLAASFEGLNSSLAQVADELWKLQSESKEVAHGVLKVKPTDAEGVDTLCLRNRGNRGCILFETEGEARGNERPEDGRQFNLQMNRVFTVYHNEVMLSQAWASGRGKGVWLPWITKFYIFLLHF